MKLNQKHLNIVSGLLILLAGILYALTVGNSKTQPGSNTYLYGKWTSIALIIAALFFMMPWMKKKE
jgi:hypothetical protein